MYKVFGHLQPDTDSTCSAIAFAWLLNQQNIEAKPYVLGEISKEAAYLLAYFELEKPELLAKLTPEDEVVIVDTNNPEELPAEINLAKLKIILDHHKLVAGLSTAEPITVNISPLACTATLIWEQMQRAKLIPTTKIAGIMLGAILSDTLKFSSPTTTATDQEVATKLAEITGVNIDNLAAGMFAAKSDLSDLSPKEIVLSDSKIISIGKYKLRISNLETTDIKYPLSIKKELQAAMKVVKKEEALDGFFLFIVNIFENSATLLVNTDFERKTASQAFAKPFNEETLYLPGIVSRKKQIVPVFEKVLA
jgi:manganese-dependent inorganic pyrophosphatase